MGELYLLRMCLSTNTFIRQRLNNALVRQLFGCPSSTMESQLLSIGFTSKGKYRVSSELLGCFKPICLRATTANSALAALARSGQDLDKDVETGRRLTRLYPLENRRQTGKTKVR